MRFNPDTSLRTLERLYEAAPSPENLVRYWKARLRAGYTLELTEIPAEFSSYQPLQQLLMDNNQHLTIFGYDEIIQRARWGAYLLFDEIAHDHERPGVLPEDVDIQYVGFLPHFYQSADSESQELRELGSVPGLLVLVTDRSPTPVPINPLTVAIHFSSYPTISSTLDLEAFFHRGRDHLRILEANSCLENPDYAPLTIGNFESVISNEIDCYPLIALYSQLNTSQ